MSAPKPNLSAIPLIFLLALSLTISALAQSTHSGWGATPYHDTSGSGVTFRVWAPHASSLFVPGTFNGWSTTATPLSQEETNGAPDGVWSADVPGVTTNAQYKFYLNNNGSYWKHDPRARWVTAAGDASGANDIVYDPSAFNWAGDTPVRPPLNDLFIYELHIGTFPGSALPSRFAAAANKLGYLQSLGVNAVEVMPIAEFGNSGNTWGYDPAQIFAADNSQYGGPDAFKTFVRACHAHGIAVLLDVVHNHYGPDDLDMWDFDGWSGTNSVGGGGIYFCNNNPALQITPYGDTRPNFTSNQVSAFVADNFTMWLSECHVDGFRWDTPNLMMHDNNNNYLPYVGDLIQSINNSMHSNFPGAISIAEDVYQYIGFDSTWDTSIPYAVIPVLTNAIDANRDMTVIANAIQNSVRYGGAASQSRVEFLESHDVVGDLNGGVRLATAIDPATPTSYRAKKLSTLGAVLTLTAPGIPMIFQGQEMLENQALDSGLSVSWNKTNLYAGIVRLYRDLIAARRNLKGFTPGLQGDQCAILEIDAATKLVAFHRWKSSDPNQDAVIVGNFSSVTLTNYSLRFPSAGQWFVHFNTDSTNYSANFSNVLTSVVTASTGPAPGRPAIGNVTIGPYTALVLSRTPDTWPTLSASNAAISWPAAYFGWTLQTTPSLASRSWTAVTPSQLQTNNQTLSFVPSPSTTDAFFRLQAPPP